MNVKKDHMNILCVLHSMYHFHYYRSILQELIDRGHTIQLLADEELSKTHSLEPVTTFARMNSRFTYGWLHRRTGISRHILSTVREMRTFRRFLRVSEQSEHYQDRWLKYYLPRFLRGLFKYIPGTKRILRTTLAGHMLEWVEQSIRPVRTILEDIQKYNPDVVLVGPGNIPYPEEVEYIKAARPLGIPTITPVFSWDNLTTKEVFHIAPDILLVWNEAQVKEVAQHHENIKSSQLRIIGAPVFDQWFSELRPSTTREEFCSTHGLRAEDPILLYLGTTRKFAVDEVSIVRDVKKLLENARGLLSSVQLIVRPHPENSKNYEVLNEEQEGVRVIPKGGAIPNTQERLQLYYDTLCHSRAVVVGVHTSAMIESCIMDKPLIVMTNRVSKQVQAEVQHFQQFLGSGALELVDSDDELRTVLYNLVNGKDDRKEKRKAFVKSFVRPYGLHVGAGERAAEEIERFVTTCKKPA